MKKRIGCFAAAMLLVCALVGCGGSKTAVSTDGSTSMSKVIGALSETFEADTGITVTYNATGDVITTVSSNPDAIGYASLASVKDTVKALTVNGVVPTEASVKDGSYVVQRPFVLVTKDGTKLSDSAQKFFDYITSEAASKVISNAGAVPVK